MHSYQIDVDKRNKPLWVMMGAASVVTAIFAGWLNTLDLHSTIKNLLPAPSAFLVFLAFYWLFDHWLWRWPFIRWFFTISEPNLSGIWQGKLKSNTHDKEIDLTLKIKQRWSKISIAINFDKSVSSSFSAAILSGKALPVLIYNYDNTPHDRVSNTMTRHIGTAELVLCDINTLTGNYFNSGDRKTEGSISVVKTASK